jgi:hypothetical protein
MTKEGDQSPTHHVHCKLPSPRWVPARLEREESLIKQMLGIILLPIIIVWLQEWTGLMFQWCSHWTFSYVKLIKQRHRLKILSKEVVKNDPVVKLMGKRQGKIRSVFACVLLSRIHSIKHNWSSKEGKIIEDENDQRNYHGSGWVWTVS